MLNTDTNVRPTAVDLLVHPVLAPFVGGGYTYQYGGPHSQTQSRTASSFNESVGGSVCGSCGDCERRSVREGSVRLFGSMGRQRVSLDVDVGVGVRRSLDSRPVDRIGRFLVNANGNETVPECDESHGTLITAETSAVSLLPVPMNDPKTLNKTINKNEHAKDIEKGIDGDNAQRIHSTGCIPNILSPLLSLFTRKPHHHHHHRSGSVSPTTTSPLWRTRSKSRDKQPTMDMDMGRDRDRDRNRIHDLEIELEELERRLVGEVRRSCVLEDELRELTVGKGVGGVSDGDGVGGVGGVGSEDDGGYLGVKKGQVCMPHVMVTPGTPMPQ